MKAKRLFTVGLAVCMAGMFGLTACGENKEQTLKLDDGKEYVGMVENGVPNGQGTLTDMMGSEWKGNFVDGKLEGFGTYCGYDLEEYEGFFKNGVFSGYGHLSRANGDELWGMFENGKSNGVGRCEYTTACVYEGGWVNGYMEGMGWMTWPVGDVYFGEWKSGDPTGFGCKLFYDPALSTCVKGDLSTYNIYVGNMLKNMMNGWGIMRFSEKGAIYSGNWDNGVRDDENGIYFFEENSVFLKYVGAFSKSKNNGWIWGEGTMYYKDGRIVTGIWENTTCVEVISETAGGNTAALTAEAEAMRERLLSNDLLQSAAALI